MSDQTALSNFVGKTINNLTWDELMLLYRMYNYLIQITEEPPKNVYLSYNQAILLHRMFISTKQSLVKSINQQPKKMNDFISTIHINPNTHQ